MYETRDTLQTTACENAPHTSRFHLYLRLTFALLVGLLLDLDSRFLLARCLDLLLHLLVRHDVANAAKHDGARIADLLTLIKDRHLMLGQQPGRGWALKSIHIQVNTHTQRLCRGHFVFRGHPKKRAPSSDLGNHIAIAIGARSIAPSAVSRFEPSTLGRPLRYRESTWNSYLPQRTEVNWVRPLDHTSSGWYSLWCRHVFVPSHKSKNPLHHTHSSQHTHPTLVSRPLCVLPPPQKESIVQ